MIAQSSYSVAAHASPFPSRSMVACKDCGAHFDLVPTLIWFEDGSERAERERAGACPVCGAIKLYEGEDFFVVPGA